MKVLLKSNNLNQSIMETVLLELALNDNWLKRLINKDKSQFIRINEKRMRFSRFSILSYIQSKTIKS